ncbi:DUSAM domain-containing protein [Pyxidicoccus sp. 3LFB2]
MAEKVDWEPFRELAQRALRDGTRLDLTDDERALLLRTAQEVAIRDAAEALATDSGTRELVAECSRRIKEGSWRLMRALHRMYRHQEKGDFDNARQEMRDVLAAEVVPYYRQLAQEQLEDMDDAP